LTEDVRAGCTPIALVASAGDVNTGRVDPIPEMVVIARRFGVWLHVDGAYGGFGVLDERVRHLYGNLADVDSLAIDPHKWLAVPVGCGACFVRDSDLLGRAFTIEPGEYVRMQPAGTTDPGSAFDERGEGDHDFTIDFSTPSRGLAVWAVLKEIGAEGMAARVRRHLDCARRVAELCRESPELELLAEPVLSICCFRYRPPGVTDEAAIDRANERVALAVRAAGRCTPSTTRVHGRFAIRPCFINPRTELADAEALVVEVLRAGRSL
ncbi:MAG TPA: pyridoxal-dependent decarboxylase, partial [Myxococcota bacterium]|nr:pyridoxal-dependent decarboxylase [Myxococcota bacterium]